MRARTIGQGVAAASLAFGLTDILLGKRFGRAIGAGSAKGGMLFRSVGAREIATGLAGFARPESRGPVWARFMADLGDLAALGFVLARPNPRRGMATLTLGVVAAVAAVDFAAARALDRACDDHNAKPDPAFGLNGD